MEFIQWGFTGRSWDTYGSTNHQHTRLWGNSKQEWDLWDAMGLFTTKNHDIFIGDLVTMGSNGVSPSTTTFFESANLNHLLWGSNRGRLVDSLWPFQVFSDFWIPNLAVIISNPFPKEQVGWSTCHQLLYHAVIYLIWSYLILSYFILSIYVAI